MLVRDGSRVYYGDSVERSARYQVRKGSTVGRGMGGADIEDPSAQQLDMHNDVVFRFHTLEFSYGNRDNGAVVHAVDEIAFLQRSNGFVAHRRRDRRLRRRTAAAFAARRAGPRGIGSETPKHVSNGSRYVTTEFALLAAIGSAAGPPRSAKWPVAWRNVALAQIAKWGWPKALYAAGPAIHDIVVKIGARRPATGELTRSPAAAASAPDTASASAPDTASAPASDTASASASGISASRRGACRPIGLGAIAASDKQQA